MPVAPGGGVAPPQPLTPWTITDSLQTWPWLFVNGGFNYCGIGGPCHITQLFGQNGETGIDLSEPWDAVNGGTPITSLTYGTVLGVGTYGGGGVVSINSVLPGMGHTSVYYQHLDTMAVKPGDTVFVGQLIGTSGGQNSGGLHPATPQFSSGPHIEVGLNAPYGSFWAPLGTNTDPKPWLDNLIANGPTTYDRIASINQVVGGVVGAITGLLSGNAAPTTHGSDFLAIEQEIDGALTYQTVDWSTITSGLNWWDLIIPWKIGSAISGAENNLQAIITSNVRATILRLILFLIGFIIIVAFIFNLSKGKDDQQAKDTGGLPTATRSMQGFIPADDAGMAAGGTEMVADAAPLAAVAAV